MSRTLKYRPEIDGLRTVAVLAVLIFHIRPGILPGGFLGVDVFFVISGFLITSIIYRQLEEGTFSLITFWKRRFKRLYPALCLTVSASILVGAIMLPQPERGALPLQGIAALFSFSNILLWRTTGGYWNNASENISLLHTWSLSLEEQFYICFPIFLVIVFRFVSRNVKPAVLTLFVASLVLCVATTHTHANATFYLLPTRMWELLVGGMLALHRGKLPEIGNSKAIVAFQAIGLGLIVAGYLFIENSEGFPGLFPLIPCVGTLLILAYGGHVSRISNLLSSRPVVYIGKISYSIYLWHWPIIVYSLYTGSFSTVGVVILTIILASLSYHFVETPFRKPLDHPKRYLLGGMAGVAMCFAALFYFPHSPLLRNLGDFDDAASLTRGWEFEATDAIRNSESVFYNDGKKPLICVVGSSHARVICEPIRAFAQARGFGFISLATSGVGITATPSNGYPDADEINRKRIDILKELNPKVIIVAGMWSSELLKNPNNNLIAERIQELASVSENLFVLGQVPRIELPDGYKRAMRKYIVSMAVNMEPIKLVPVAHVLESNEMLQEEIAKLNNSRITYLDPYNLFISDDGFVDVLKDNQFVYSDYHHLNDAGAGLLFEKLLENELVKFE